MLPSEPPTAIRWPSFEMAAAVAFPPDSNAFSFAPVLLFQVTASLPGPTLTTLVLTGDIARPTLPAPTASARVQVTGAITTVLSALAVMTEGVPGCATTPRTAPVCGNAWRTVPVA